MAREHHDDFLLSCKVSLVILTLIELLENLRVVFYV